MRVDCPLKVSNWSRASLLAMVLLLAGCERAASPDLVAAGFWGAALAGDSQLAEHYAVPESFDSQRFAQARYGETFDTLETGLPNPEFNSKRARIATTLYYRAEGEIRRVTFETLLARRNGHWQVDYAATAQALSTALLGRSVREAENRAPERTRQELRRELLDEPPAPQLQPGSGAE